MAAEKPDFQNNKVLLDTSSIIANHNRVQAFLQDIGNPEIYHTTITIEELRDHFIENEMEDEEATRRATRSLRRLNSTFLPAAKGVEEIAKVIEGYLLQAGIPEEIIAEERNDILTVAYGMVYGMDVLSRDKLFYVMGRLFSMNIVVHTILAIEPEGWAEQSRIILNKNGIQTPIDLTHLLDSIFETPS